MHSSLMLLLVALGSADAAAPPSPPTDSAPAVRDRDDGPKDEAEAESADGTTEAAAPWWMQERLTGDWGGARSRLQEAGFTFDLGLTTTFQQNVKGGIQTRNAHRITGRYDLELTFDTHALKLWDGGTLYANGVGSWNGGVSDYVGDLFGADFNAEGNQEIYLAQLWYEQAWLDRKLRFRFGKLWLPLDFDTNAFANDSYSQFLNSGLNNAPNIPFQFQNYVLGAQLVAAPCDWFYVAAGVNDANADQVETNVETTFHGPADFLSLYEMGFTPTWETAWGQLPGGYRFGVWYDPEPKPKFFDDLDGRLRTVPMKRDDLGFYTSCDQVIFRENPAAEDDEQGFGLFFRYAYAPGDVNVIKDFWSVGGQYQGLFPTRDDDVLGFGVAQGILSPNLHLIDMDPHRETALELYYNVHLLPWLTVSPDFQWILRPGGENGRDAFVVGLRLQMSF